MITPEGAPEMAPGQNQKVIFGSTFSIYFLGNMLGACHSRSIWRLW